jgi:type II secretory pathway pseudopilin PulG
MLESLAAVTIVSVSGTALLAAAMAAVQSSSQGTNVLVAQGIADQLMDEIAAARFPDGVSPAPPRGTLRAQFNDLDDFSGWSAQPPTDRQGTPLGTEGMTVGSTLSPRPDNARAALDFLKSLTESVTVERVQPDGAAGWYVVSQHTGYRRVTVRVSSTDANSVATPLATNVRIFAAVAMTP